MGKAIEAIALQRGHTIGLRVDSRNAGAAPTGCAVAIEFSRPEHALGNMRLCLEHGVPVVVGTTGDAASSAALAIGAPVFTNAQPLGVRARRVQHGRNVRGPEEGVV